MSDPFRLLDRYAEALLAGYAASTGGAVEARLARHRRLADALARAVAALDPTLSNGNPKVEARRRRAALLVEAPALQAHVELLDRCAGALGDVLSGARAGTDIIFPGGAMDLVARIYDGTAWADHFNRLAAEAVARMAEALIADGVGHVRILEIGAGTGGTSRHVLGALNRFTGSLTYDYTDVSPGFVAHGRTRFAERHLFARFRILDIERPPVAQGFETGAYHAVVATNVLHATRRIDQALGHAGLLLAPGGALVLNEVTRASLFATLTFGLLDGWWRFEDADARLPGAPLLDRARWTVALASVGFAAPACFGWQGAADSFQTLFVGERSDPVMSVAPQPPVAQLVPASSPAEGPVGRVAAVVARVLGLDVAEIEPDRPLAEVGVDSIVAAQIATALADSLGVALAPSEIYDHATVAGLERHLAASLPAAVQTAPTQDESDTEPEASSSDNDIAVIGIACRFPGAADREAFWRNLVGGVCSITEVPVERWDWRPHFAETRSDGRTVSRWGGFLDGHDLFDPEPFRITHGEARAMSPQQRLFLETAWHALEDAGYGRAELAGTKCGVFVGVAPDGWGGDRADARSSLGDSNAILSARLAYALDLKGSCLPIDTACSSSLVAVHLAARSLIDGDNAMALAGGVSVLMGGPRLHVFLSDSGMASPSGLCRTFDAGADGFVPGEGVGVVVLKRLDRARADGDHVYAVIKASGVNQDGTTSGITAPSGPAQTALEREVYARGGIDARSIGMVEAHGTGTKLGDPIEVNALARAFRADTPETGFCRLGSVKSNIGHTLTAAGIAGFIKAVLAVGRGVVPPSLHYTAANPEIDFASSPFRVVTAAEPWQGHDGLPRRAAVSSFGFSGTNAHIVLEAPPPRPASMPRSGPRLVAVSAKTAEALDRRLADLARLAADIDAPFPWLAWTATVGRTHFEHRAAIIANDVKEFCDLSRDLIEQRMSASARRAVVSSRQNAAGLQVVPDTLEAAAEAFLAGKPVDLAAVFDRGDRMRVSLPVYPFERLRFAPPESAARSAAPSERHPLIAGNESSLDGLRFRLAGADGWPGLADHRFHGRSIWPAAAIIEAMWACGRLGLGEGAGGFELSDVSFAAPLAVGDAGWLIVERTEDGVVALRLVGAEDRVHARARLLPMDAVPARRIDVAALRMAEGRRIDRATAYDALAAIGFDHGPSFRTIAGMTVHGDRVLAALAPADGRGFDWPPGATDGAIQAAVGLALVDAADGRMTVVPGGVAQVRLHGSLDRATHVLVERRMAEPGRVRLDINLLDADGVVLAELLGLEAVIRETAGTTAIKATDAVVAYEPYWRPDVGAAPAAAVGFALLLPEGAALEGGDELQRLLPAADAAGWRACFAAMAASGTVPERIADLRSLFVSPSPTSDAVAAEASVQTMAALVSGWLLALPGRPLRLVRAYRYDGQAVPAEACLDGLARALALEAPEVSLSLLGLDAAAAAPVAAVAAEFAQLDVRHALVRRGARMTRAWRQVTGSSQAGTLPERPVVIVTGAHGGLGAATARHLAQTRKARLVLVSRRSAPVAGSDLARMVTRLGGEAVEITADIANPAGARAAVDAALSAFGRVDVVVHAAGVIRDGLLRGRAPTDIAAVLAPKLAGTIALLDALAGQPVQAFVCYGSLAAVFGNAGQADYAAANAFMGALAERDGLPLVTVDWPFWRDGGLAAREDDDAKLRTATGTRWIETAEGLAMLDLALAAGRPRLAVAAGDPARIARLFAGEMPAIPAAIAEVAGGISAEDPLVYLRGLLAEVTGAPPNRLRAEREIEDLALDSMHVTQLNDRLERDFGRISKTLFYECRTLGEVAARLGVQAPRVAGSATAQTRVRDEKSAGPERIPLRKPRVEPVEDRTRHSAAAAPIAIVGIAGRFPGAEDLDSFWANLVAGRDCVTEIPDSRWDHGRVFDPTPGRPGKAYGRWGGFLAQVDGFDPLFFGIAPAEAERMDPQERLALETAWEAMEDAGLTRSTLCAGAGRLGAVYIGVMYGDYQMLGAEQHALGNPVAASSPYWSIANRLSYVLDLRGPSLAVDSACSSSLTALHLACRSLWSGEAEVALAGGVNLSLHPLKYVGLSQGRFASTDGRCRSFGAGGDGYVPGEGVAIAILKPLAAALAAGDRIHGVIRGSAVNHGGRTNGYTVPSPAAQAGAIRAALVSADMTAADIDYVEAHGTGTALGDPIEIEGLAAAFAAAPGEGACPIGTVKSSIGHLEAAAGMAGLAKVLLQFRHATLAPTLLHGGPNPAIDFDAARLRLVTASEPWRPRRPGAVLVAGISSFGAGGANAHLIVEAPPPIAAPVSASGPFAFVVSARTLEQLQAYVDRLRLYFGRTETPVADVARTLQLGREAMAVRLGFVAGSLAEAAERLTRWRAGEAGAVHLHVPADEDAPVPGVDAGADLEALVGAWVRGAPVPWATLDLAGRRTFVPVRPFMRRRYWPKTIEVGVPQPRVAEVTLDPSMPIVDHHRVGGTALVPAALLLALARDASGGSTALSEVVLHRAAEMAGVSLVLRTSRDGAALSVETSDGAALLTARAADAVPATPIPAPSGGETLTPADAYRRFATLGIEYGPYFRRLGRVTSDGEVAEAEIRAVAIAERSGMPVDEAAVTALDAAMQAIIALVPDAIGIAGVPHRIDRVSWHGDPAGLVRARVRAVAADRFDVDGLDEAGGPLVSLRGLHVRRLASAAAAPAPDMLVPVWREAAAGTAAEFPRHLLIVHGAGTSALAQALADAVGHATRFDLFGRDDDALRQALQAAPIPVDAIAVLGDPLAKPGDPVAVAAEAERLALGFLDVARALSRCPVVRRPARLIVVTSGLYDVTGREGIDPVGAALPGMARSLAAELPQLVVVLVDIDRAEPAAEAARRSLAERPFAQIRDVAWRGGRRFERRLVRATIEATREKLPPNPLCVVTGGSGGLGRALAGHLAARHGARVVLSGRRSSLDGALPAGVVYVAADVCDEAAVARLTGQVVAEHGRLDAIFHLPLVLADRRLAQMSDDEFRAAFAPKAAGTAHVLAAARRHGARVMVFSSANVFAGADGQANYVAGSAVQDALAFAAGASVQVVNWGLWGEIGAVADAATQERLAEAGILPIRPAEGFAALDRLLASPLRQVAVVKATPAALARLGLSDDTPAESARAVATTGLASAAAAFDRLETYGRARLLVILAAATGSARRAFTAGGLARRLGVVARHGRLFDALLAMLGRHGLAETRDGVIRLPAPGVDPAALLAEATAALDAASGEAPWLARPRALLDAALDRYGELLAGIVDPLGVLFPGGSTALVEGAYRGNPLSDTYNASAAAAVAAHRRAGGPGWRAIEVGAGTGGTTGAVLAELDRGAAPEAYLYTDLSRRFLEHGQAAFGGDRRWVSTALYDVEQSVEANGQQVGTFDAVIAANVLHATAGLTRVLVELRRLLRPGGLLAVTELIAAQDYGTLVFGLTEGWWKSADASRIAHSPVIDAAGWERRLADAGFVAVERVDFAAAGGRGQAVFLAIAPAMPDMAMTVAAAAPARKTSVVAALSPVGDDRLRQALLAHLRGVFADVLKLDPAEMRAADPFEQYGLESLTAMQIRDRLDAGFGALSQTLLFEHGTLASLADHLMATREDAVRAVLGIAAEPAKPAPAPAPRQAVTETVAPGNRSSQPSSQPIAIIGMAGRFPGAGGLDAFWRLLEEGRSAIGPIPEGRWPPDGRAYTKWGGFLDEIDCFDPLFFGIAPADAAAIDPQERLFLETAWHALEHAGYTPARLNASGPVGVYVGVMNAGYQWLAAQRDAEAPTPATSAYWSIANRLSFVADFAGPSLAVDTACSSSLTALHLAVQALRAGDCAAAVVGGVNLIVHPRQMANLCEARMLSGGAENRAFAAGADGFVDGEGVAAIVLKPLDAAIACGDRIEAVIRATAINAGGKTSGFSVPSPVAQAGVIADALRAAGVAPSTIGFVEAHGTGTTLGDPIEISGIASALGGSARPSPLVLGALKANIGHLESAAGIAGVIKTVLQLGHARIAPLRHAEHPNPLIDFAAAGCRVPVEATAWPASAGSDETQLPRRAGVSSFGAGGANAHVILEEAPARTGVAATLPLRDVLALSAADEPALRRLAASLRPAVAAADAAALAEILHTLRIGRRAFSLRAAAVVDGAATAGRILDAVAAGRAAPGLASGNGAGPSARRIEETAEGRRMVEAMLAAGDADGLVGLWADGVTVDWSRLPWAADRRIVALPGYPFARERYWLDGAATAARAEPAPASKPGHVTRLIRGAWLPAPLVAAEHPAIGRWALVGSTRLLAAIERQGAPALHRVPGQGFDPTEPAAWMALVDAVAANGPPLDLVVAPDALGTGPAAAVQTMFLALRAMARRPGRIARLLVAAEGSAATIAGLAALARSAAEEGFNVRAIMVPPDLDPAALAAILSEEGAARDAEPVVDRREDRRRWARTWLETPDEAAPLFRAGGRYLIAGGLGEVGRALAAHLVAAHGATIGILGRTAPGDARQRLDAIGGAAVHYAAADLTDRAALERAVAELNRAMGGIDGVLDLARLVDNAPIARKDPDAFARVLAVKAVGTTMLDAALADERLDFFVVFSSLAAWYGLAGGADYAAACAIQEGLMAERAVRVRAGERHGLSLAVAWPQWLYDGELDAARRRRLETAGLAMIDAAAGIAILDRAGVSGEVAVAAVAGTPGVLAPLAETPTEALDALSDDELAAYVDALRAVAGDDVADASPAATIDLVRQAFAEQLRVDPARIGGDVPFADLGLDSIKALHVAERLSRDLGIDVEPALFFDHPMAGGLAAALDARRAAAFRVAGE